MESPYKYSNIHRVQDVDNDDDDDDDDDDVDLRLQRISMIDLSFDCISSVFLYTYHILAMHCMR